MSAVLEVRDLRKVYHLPTAERAGAELVAVDDVSFSLTAGGALAVVGQSGAGKSTIARLIAGIEAPTSGSIKIAGREEEKGRAMRRRAVRMRRAREVQMVFQDPYSSLDPRQTVADSITEILRIHFDQTANVRSDRVAELLDQVGLDGRHAGSYPRELSGGQRQRVAIARALSLEPRLLILDEAVSALDVSVQAQILNLLARLRSEAHEDISILFISHDLAVVRQVCDDCLIMNRGRVVESGSTDVVLTRPQSEFTQTLLAAVPRRGWVPQRRAAL